MNGVAAYEPPIVTTLRRYLHRKAPASLLFRLAGGPENRRWLNSTWGIDGRSYTPAPVDRDGPDAYGFCGIHLATEERRLALLQLAIDCIELGEVFPTSAQLSVHFDVAISCIDHDIAELRDQQKIFVSVAGSNHGPRRVLRLPGVEGATAVPALADE